MRVRQEWPTRVYYRVKRDSERKRNERRKKRETERQGQKDKRKKKRGREKKGEEGTEERGGRDSLFFGQFVKKESITLPCS